MPELNTDDEAWGVVDLNAPTGESRRHQPVKGHFYDLRSDVPKKMPPSHAARFLKVEGFVVTGAAGRPMNSLPTSEEQSRVATLPKGWLLARVEELTSDALLARALNLPGGEKFTARTKKDVLLAFVTEHSGGAIDTVQPAGNVAEGAEDAAGDGLADMKPDEADKFFED